MRVLHLVKGLGPGGAERLLVSLAACRSDDVEIAVAYLLPHKSHLVTELQQLDVEVHLLSGRLGLSDPRWPSRLRSVVNRLAPDVVHVHSPAVAPPARVALRLSRHRPLLVSTEHNVWPSFGRVTRWANALTLPLDDISLAVSEEVRSSAWARYRERIDVVIHGVPVAALRARRAERAPARAALGVADDEILIATVANFREKKDYPTLLRVAAACALQPTLRFVAIGQGPLEASLHALHDRLGVGDQFRFLGYHPDPAAVVVGADLFVLTSRHEGLPIALLEAMALGVPPVVTGVGGIPEVVTDGVDGILREPGDVAGIADAIQALARDGEGRAALAARAAQRATHFDIRSAQRTLEALYRTGRVGR